MAVVRRDDPVKKPEQADEGEGKRRGGLVGWIVGWIVIPGLVIAGIFGSGMHLGANNPDAWYVAAVKWVASLFSP